MRLSTSPLAHLPLSSADPVESAHLAGLRYVSDDEPGIRRLRTAAGFLYRDQHGKRIRDAHQLARINALVIPPAWTHVWICSHANGHLQATGRDARGRKQYRYHPQWRTVRDGNKFEHTLAFAKALPLIRARTAADLKRPGLPREKVLATIVQLLERSLIRVGNEEYARTNRSYGLTTLRVHHVEVGGSELQFRFRGKSGIVHNVAVRGPRLAHIVARCQELPGQRLFQYLDDDGVCHSVDSADVNAYLQEITGQKFTAKDFRTWAGTVLAVCALQVFAEVSSQRQAKKNVVTAVAAVAKRLGNTRAICRKCYIHPQVIEAYLEGMLRPRFPRIQKVAAGTPVPSLSPEETAVLSFLKRRLASQTR